MKNTITSIAIIMYPIISENTVDIIIPLIISIIVTIDNIVFIVAETILLFFLSIITILFSDIRCNYHTRLYYFIHKFSKLGKNQF